MPSSNWRDRAATLFDCEKQSATGSRGMVVANNPLASAAGMEMLAAGGNAIDAVIATFFTLTVVEPMMVGIVGGGMAHIRFGDGRHTVIDGMVRAPLSASADCYTPVSDSMPDYLETIGRENAIGPKAVAAPGNLMAWCEILRRFGTLPLADVMAPAIKWAAHGYRATPYLVECVSDAASDLARDAEISKIYLPEGAPIKPGHLVVQSDYAETLKAIAEGGSDVLYGGALGHTIVDYIKARGGFLSMADLDSYRTVEREAVRGTYRGYDIVGPPPPSSGGVHVIQMLNLLEGFDVGGLGFGSAENLHLLAEVLKIAFADRKAATADPDFVDVPVDRLLSKAYADERRPEIDLNHAKSWGPGVALPESPNTTHVTVADKDGNVIAMTQTINSTFGARIMIPGTGVIPNNYMHVFDPHPGQSLSIAPGKRVTSSMAPVMAIKDGTPVLTLGLPGGLRIFGSAMQGLMAVIDHGMSVQEAVEAPRIWTQGQEVELEPAFPAEVRDALAQKGHDIVVLPHIGGGMNAIQFDDAGMMTGAACWRADGAPVAMGGGLARLGVRFWPEKSKR
ncbi:MAG: gamma-glutamyltransferase [Alphaproteobacteria bacterium]|nr:gamma-glutamyltransferase [Alphaproteobacteria bacterium]